jgi:hypothetical protein
MNETFLLPVCTARFTSRAHFNIRPGAVYIYGESVENRSHLPQNWVATQDCHFFRVEEQDYESFAFTVSGKQYRLRSRVDVETFIDRALDVSQLVYLDITGLSHHVWAPLLSELGSRIVSSSSASIQLFGVYVEPVHYTKSRVPRPGDIFALSDKLHGIRPLPGLVRLRRHESDKAMIVALLGFEGWRFDAVLAKLEPDAGTVVPIIGVPGFRAEFPFYTLEGNIIPLERDDNWTRRKFATANDPFEVYHILDILQHRYSETLLRIAMVGTKPHALGAVLFHAVYPRMSELIYDNPVRSAGRTDSDRTLLEYDISSFLSMTSAPLSLLG